MDLEKITYNSNLDTNNICPIFQVEFKNGMEIIKLPCNHSFIPEAISKWLKEEKAVCPVCRHNLDSKEVEDEQSYNPTNRQRTENLFQSIRRSYTPSLLNTIINPTASLSPNLNQSENEDTDTAEESDTDQRLSTINQQFYI